METYIGKHYNAGIEVNFDEKYLVELLEGIDAAGRNFTCDKGFTRFTIARMLLKKVNLAGRKKK
jgi:hypothetical protein